MQMKIAREEIFGPVMCVMKFDTEEEVCVCVCVCERERERERERKG